MSGDRDRAFFGHPIGLMTLFFTELFERFSYYGMRAFLGFYLTVPKDLGGMGMLEDVGGGLIGVFGATVYLLSLPGGWVADRFLGQQRSVIIGGIGIAVGNALLAIPGEAAESMLWPGLLTIALGTGFLKPNVSTIVGQLYTADDNRRDAGFTIYYMGINIGATFAPFVCGWLAGEGLQTETFRGLLTGWGLDPNLCWHFAFGAASLGMVFGLLQYVAQRKYLGEAGKHPTVPADPARAKRDVTILQAMIGAIVALAIVLLVVQPTFDSIASGMGLALMVGSIALFIGLYRSAHDGGERRRVIAMIPLFLGAVGFFGIFEQAPTTLNFYAKNIVEREFLGINIPASFYQSVNGFFIVALAPVFAAIWMALSKRNKEPTSVTKFAIGMVFVAMSFVIMLPTLGASPTNKVSGG